ncbi:ABC-2 type transport system ATP-binding protein [Kribbella orskensis]|uniref:ABC-2 type transport system ATP-binding protein n=1 Tax=Kribbella orskensis TaxID=2512216 RepID=A0ABY2BCJ1_9ACTN|nr:MULTISPECIES: ATP-binding cassette domain-containing protein [Kribbella]TCN35089.1 ABC-2 type transport system ATP-binding protein [Kribbella sp. VKM Ac-2500]TCO16456.1 ABC-2 type transport system ATP-binding protein [Kribbella orskensis]
MIVEAVGLRKSFGPTSVLEGVDLAVPEGSVLALLGPNGAGKTTIVRILTTLARPDEGHATIAGYDVVREPAKVRGVISLTGQHAAVDDNQTGLENLVMVGRLMHLKRGRARQRAQQLLEQFDLTGAMNRRAKTYSGGMGRRLDLAMSLVARPRVIFLDEPTTGLDPASRLTMWHAIGDLVRDGTTILLTTQYLEEADRLADRIVLLDKGRITASGTADALKTQIGGERIELYLADEVAARKAAGLLGGLADGPLLNLPSDGTAAHLHHVLDQLRDEGLLPSRVSSHRPTLDDVFLTLTAQELR